MKNNQFSINIRDNDTLLDVSKNDPIIILNKTKSNSKNVVLSYEIESPHNTLFQLFYKETPQSKYNEKDSYRVHLKKGLNKINLLMPSKYINNALRVDLVSSIGKYKIKRFEIYDK